MAPARMVPAPQAPATTPDPPTSVWGAWQGRVNWAVNILLVLISAYLLILESKRPATTLQPTQAPVVAPVPTVAPPAAAPAVAPADVPGEAPLPLPLAGGFLLMPFAGMLKGARERARERIRLLAQRGALVALAVVCFLAVLGSTIGCARLTDQVKADNVSAVALWGQYVQGDAHLTPAQKADRATLGTQQTYIGTSGWASKAYVDVAQTITCQLDRYVQGDAALGADVRAGLVKMDRGIRVALKLPADCPAPGVTP